MARRNRVWQARIGVSAWAIGTTLSAVAPKLSYVLDYELLLQMMVVQGIVAIAIGLTFGLITVILARSVKAGGIVLLGIFYGVMVGGTSSFAIGWLLHLLFAPRGGTGALLPGFGWALAAVIFWILG